eukprot:2169053-Amphidinium_carterae.1
MIRKCQLQCAWLNAVTGQMIKSEPSTSAIRRITKLSCNQFKRSTLMEPKVNGQHSFKPEGQSSQSQVGKQLPT